MTTGGLGFGFERQKSAGCGDRRLGLRVVLVGITLTFRADALADRDDDLFFVREADPDGAVFVIDTEAGRGGRQILFKVVVEVVSLTEDVIKIAVFKVHIVAEFAPVETRGLGGDETAHDDEDHEKNSASADAARGNAIALGLLIFDQLDHAPKNQQSGPVVREQRPQPHPRKHVQVAHQEDDPDHNQHKWSGKGATAMAQRDKRWRSMNGIRHCAPRPKKTVIPGWKSMVVAVAPVAWARQRVAFPAKARCARRMKRCSAPA